MSPGSARQESVTPIRSSPLGKRDFRQHHETGDILIVGTQTVGHPRADGRVATEAIAGVHLVHRRRMVDRIDLATPIEADVVHNFRELMPVGRDVGSALPSLPELKWTTDIVSLATFHRRLHDSIATEFV